MTIASDVAFWALEAFTPRSRRPGAPPKVERTLVHPLLAAAGNLFYRRGVASTGVDAIASASGVSKPSLYRWYATKDELVAAVLRHQDERFWRWWDAVLADAPADPEARLRALLAGLAAGLDDPDFRGCPFLNAASDLRSDATPASALLRAHNEQLQQRLSSMCADADVAAPAEAAASLMMLINGACATSLVAGREGLGGAFLAAAARLLAAPAR